MRALFVLLCLCGLVSPSARTEETPPHPTQARLEAVAGELKQNWLAVKSIVRRPNTTNFEKSSTVDAFFSHLAAVAEKDGEDIIAYLAQRTREAQSEPAAHSKGAELTPEQHADGVRMIKTFIDEKSAALMSAAEGHARSTPELIESLREMTRLTTEIVDQLAEAVTEQRTKSAEMSAETPSEPRAAADEDMGVHDFVKSLRESKYLPRLDLAIHLLRDLIRLEEEKVFELIEPNAGPHQRIKISAELADDMIFIARQSRALVRLTKSFIDLGAEILERGGQDGDAPSLRRALNEEVPKTLEKIYPVLLKSADDLGIYYAKLIQTFAGLMFHYSPEEFQKIDYVQGRIPRVMPFQMVKEIVEKDLSRPIEDLFLSFEREPLASGSIAQVHRATIVGRRGGTPIKVVVKVKKSYVADELAWNERTNHLLFKYLEIIAPEDTRFMVRFVTSQARELGVAFAGELDFKAELEKQHLFRRMLKPVKHISVPRPIRALSGIHVITSEAIESPRRIHEAFELPRGVKKSEAPSAEDTSPKAPVDAESVDASVPPDAEPASSEVRTSSGTTSPPATASAVSDDDAPVEPGREEIDPISKVAEAFMSLTGTYGYSITPRYFQLFRATIPFASVATGYTRYGISLSERGLKKGDPEVDVFMRTYQGLIGSFLYQLLYARELHADYNWGNVLVDPTNSVHLVDWAHTVDTRGILTQPALLFVALKFKGDADLVVKKLAQMGTFANLERDRKQITALVQTIIDAFEVPKRSWFGMVKATVRGATEMATQRSRYRKARTELDKNKSTPTEEAVVKPEKKDADVRESKAESVATADVAEDAPRAGITLETSENSATVTITPTKASNVKLAVTLAKGILKYPYHRTRARLVRGTQGAVVACGKMLGKE